MPHGTEICRLNGVDIQLARQPDGTAVLTKGQYLEGDGELIIPEEWNVTKVGEGVFYNNASLTEFHAPKLVSLGSHTFYHCENLAVFNAPTLAEIKHANEFFRCDSLKFITISPFCTINKSPINLDLRAHNISTALDEIIIQAPPVMFQYPHFSGTKLLPPFVDIKS